MISITLTFQSFLSLLSATDLFDGNPSIKNYQLESMYRFHQVLGLVDPEKALQRRKMFDNPDNASDVCTWTGIKCENGLITYIHWDREIYHRWYSFEWLPSTVRYIYLSSKGINSCLPTRSLPRCLQECTIINSNLEGEPDFRTLPPQLKLLDLSRNFLKGTISLTSLPLSLHRLNVTWNRFSQAFIDASTLPKNMEKCILNKRVRVHWIGGVKDSRVVLENVR